MSPRQHVIAGSRRMPMVDPYADAAVVVALIPDEDGFEVKVDNRGGASEPELAAALHMAAEQFEEKDRSKGMW